MVFLSIFKTIVMIIPFIALLAVIGFVIYFFVFAAKKKSNDKDLGERPPINSD